MKQRTLIFVVLLLAFTVIGLPMSKVDSQLKELQPELKLLETWLEAQQLYRGIPGIAIGLVYEQELIYARGFGVADLETNRPVDENTPYRIASITKTFTATALVQLRDAGKLRLDDPVVDYLPWFNVKQRFPGQQPITIRQLLTHSSGLPREADFPYWTDHNFPTMEEIKAKLGSQETIYEPATELKYSNLAMSLAGEVVAAASGMSYEGYIQEHIFDPLSMTSSTVHPDPIYQKALVTPYSLRQPDNSRNIEDYTDSKGITPAANIASTVTDLARYVSFQFRDDENTPGAVLRGTSLKEMHRVHFLNKRWTSGYGLGWAVWRRGGKTVNGHAGWVGGNRTQIMFIPEDKVAVIVLTNSDDGEPSFLARHILDFMGPAIVNECEPSASPEEFDPVWVKYTGTYVEPGPYYTEVLIRDEQLIMSTLSFPPEDSPDSEIVELSPEDQHIFRMSGSNGNGELVIFEFDEAGKINQVKVGSNYIYPEALYNK